MAVKPRPLLFELDGHTTWSDGALSVPELVDLYGRAGFDVLAVTDHTQPGAHVDEAAFPAYLGAIEAEAERARALYELLVLPGLELTYEHDEPRHAGHAPALGLHSFVGVDDGLEPALRAARAHGAALVAAHPYLPEEALTSPRSTAASATELERWAPLVDRFELFNRDTLFSWVSQAGLPAVATGDFHVREHLGTWKTLLPCAKDERAVVEYLRSRGRRSSFDSARRRRRSTAPPEPRLTRSAAAGSPGRRAGQGREGTRRLLVASCAASRSRAWFWSST